MDPVRRIRALTNCGASQAALQAEHAAIEDALETLDQAVMAGANPAQLVEIVDIALDFYESHFSNEEEALRAAGYPALDAHARAHATMLERIRGARVSIGEGQLDATLDVSDLLHGFHNHVAVFDGPAHVYLTRKALASPTVLSSPSSVIS